MSATPSPAQLPPDQDRGPLVDISTWVITAIAIIVVVVRLYTRLFLKKSAGLDDLLMLLALLTNIASSSLMILDVKNGFGRHIYYLEPSHALQARKYLSIATLTGFADQFFSRASITVFVMRMTPENLLWPQRCAWTAHVLNFTVLIVALVGFGLQCVPFRGAWDLTIKSVCYSMNISRNLIYVTGTLNCVTDLTTALTPMILLRNVHVRRGLKIGIYACLAFGLTCVVCSIGKMAQVDYSEDFTWTLVPSYIWTSFESKLAVIAGSLPALHQLYSHILDQGKSRETLAYTPQSVSSTRRSLLGLGLRRHGRFKSRINPSEARIGLHEIPSTPRVSDV